MTAAASNVRVRWRLSRSMAADSDSVQHTACRVLGLTWQSTNSCICIHQERTGKGCGPAWAWRYQQLSCSHVWCEALSLSSLKLLSLTTSNCLLATSLLAIVYLHRMQHSYECMPLTQEVQPHTQTACIPLGISAV
jgi:hypothetical protein